MFNTMRIIANKPKANLPGEDKNIIEAIFSDLGLN